MTLITSYTLCQIAPSFHKVTNGEGGTVVLFFGLSDKTSISVNVENFILFNAYNIQLAQNGRFRENGNTKQDQLRVNRERDKVLQVSKTHYKGNVYMLAATFSSD
jgi:hypothetical protein